MRQQQIVLEELHSNEKSHERQTGQDLTALLILSGFFATAYCFFSSQEVLFAVIASLFFPLAVCISMEHKWRDVPNYILLVIIAGSILINPTGFAQGLINFGNQCITAWNNHFDAYLSLYETGGVSARAQIQFWLAATGVFYFLWEWAFRSNKLIYLCMTEAVILLAALYFQLAVSPVLCVLFVCGFSFCMMGKAYYNQGLKTMIGITFVVLAAAMLIAFFTDGFRGSQYVAQVKENILDSVDYIRYGEDTLPQGDMMKADEMVGSDTEEVLNIKGTSMNEMHLRGFVGSEFDGTRWQTLDLGRYNGDSAGILEWLTENGLMTPYQFGRFAVGSGNAEKEVDYTVENTGAYRKYLYLPYTAVDLESGRGSVEYDWQVVSNGLIGTRRYQFKAGDVGESDSSEVRSIINNKNSLGNYGQAESVYSSFAYENYLDVDEQEQTVIEDIFFHGQDWTKLDYYQITNQIRLTLQQLNEYDQTQADYFNARMDFIEWFAQGNHKLNAAAYATAAVLAYRTAGIPARYVEGYYLTEDMAEASEGQTVLTQADAHAWTEVYMNGIGWLSVEVVPGSYYADYTVQDVAPSPESTVNVVEDNEDELKGSTADTLNGKKKDKPDIPEPIRTVVYVLGILVLVILIIFTIVYLIRIQAKLRRFYFEKQIKVPENTEKQCRFIYEQIWTILKVLNWKGDSRFPYECADEFGTYFRDTDQEEYIRFLNLIQKSIFSTEKLDEAEYRTVKLFLERITDEAYRKGNTLQRLKLKYVYAV